MPAHSSGVGSAVAVVHFFVVPRGRQRNGDLAVTNREEGCLVAAEKLLDQNPVASGAEDTLAEKESQRPFRVPGRLDGQDALASRQAVGFQDGGIAEPADCRARFGGGTAHDGRRGRNFVPPEELLCENLRGLDLRGQSEER